ncbi:hypothetical protein Q666_03145 [Marinobacter sp. ES-1]|nr:hypothetical protein Q666_03145 [Marinobacter sp. ES-1]
MAVGRAGQLNCLPFKNSVANIFYGAAGRRQNPLRKTETPAA